MNALADQRVADYLNENFICTYLKVGTFQIVNGQKQGGNVASYFTLADSCVVHAVPGKKDANQFLTEARWAYEVRKSALTSGLVTNGNKIDINMRKYSDRVKQSHLERYQAEANGMWGVGGSMAGKIVLPREMPRNVNQQAQAHYLLAKEPLPKLDTLGPVVWRQVLGEQWSSLPVAKR